MLNRPIEGKLAVKVEGLTLDPDEQTVALAAGQTKELPVKVVGGQAAADNNYRLTAEFDAGSDGAVKHVELMHANVIARRTITIDGNLDDWKGVIPQTSAQSVGASMTEKAYLPFKDFGRQGSGAVTAYLAYDAKNFYFAAKVPKMDGMPRFETRNDDDYFYPEKFQSRGKELTWPAGVRRYSYRKDFEVPSGNGKHNVQIAFNVLPPEKKAMLPFPAGTMPRFCAYPDTDYEFALNKVGEAYGGGTEIFCLLRPGVPRKHFFPAAAQGPHRRRPGQGRRQTGGQRQRGRVRDSLERNSGGQAAARRRADGEVLLPREQRPRRPGIGRRPQRVERQLPGVPQRLVHPLGQRGGIRLRERQASSGMNR